MVTERFAATRAAEHARLITALAEAAEWCDAPEHRDELAEILSAAPYLNLPKRVLTPALLGRFDCGGGRVESVPDFVVFHHGGANVPDADKAVALQHELVAAGILPRGVDPELPRRLFREDLHRDALNPHHTHEPALHSDLRGVVR